MPVLATGFLSAQPAALPPVQEATLPNGVRVLLVERRGSGAVHVALTLSRPVSDGTPAEAMELLRRCLEAAEPEPSRALEALLAREDGLWASLRQPTGPDKDLQTLHGVVRKELDELLRVGELPSGASALSADDLHLGWDLPLSRLEGWARGMASRLGAMTLGAFPEVRDRWVAAEQVPGAEAGAWAKAFGLLLPATLGGGAYGTAATLSRECAADIRWEKLRALGKTLFVPERLTVTLVGDVSQERALAVLGASLGRLLESREPAGVSWPRPDGEHEGWAGRRMQAFSEGEPRVLLALRVPRAGRRDDRALHVLADVLAGGPASRLWRRLVVEQGVATRVAVHMGVPGVREAHLLVLEAAPAEGRTLQELEQALQGELARLLREGLSREDVREAQLRVEAWETLLQDDATTLARALGQAQARYGQWASAFPTLGAGGRVPELAVHQLLRTLAHPSGMLTLSLEPDTLLTPLDPSEARLIRILSDRIGQAVQDPVALDSIVRQSVQQLRLLSAAERAKILALLEAEPR